MMNAPYQDEGLMSDPFEMGGGGPEPDLGGMDMGMPGGAGGDDVSLTSAFKILLAISQ